MSAPYRISAVEYLPVPPVRSHITGGLISNIGSNSGTPGCFRMQLIDLFASLPAVQPAMSHLLGRDATISGMSLDSRAIRTGDLFLAVSGGGRHGLEFLDQALANGAVAVLWEVDADADWSAFVAARCRDVIAIPVKELRSILGDLADRFYARPSAQMEVIGVTGTDGKTSVAHLVARALHSEPAPCGLLGTLGNGFPGEMETATHTTPDVLSTHQLLAALHERGANRVVMEASSHGLDQGRVDGVRFDIAVLTNLSRDHLDYHGSVDAYAEAKRKLFIAPGLKVAVLNNDDEFGRRLLADVAITASKVAYGRTLPADADETLLIESVAAHESGLDLELGGSLVGKGKRLKLHSPLLGDFNAENLAAAFAVLRTLGITVDEAAQALAKLTAVAGRMEAFAAEGLLAVVDFAHTPAALEHALSALRGHCPGELVCVFGCGGDRDRGKRPLMAQAAAKLADRVIVTDDNPRSEDPGQIINDIMAGFGDPQAVEVERDRGAAIHKAITEASAGDVVLIAGKGHEEYQQVGDHRFYFSDRDQVAGLLGRGAHRD